MLHNKHSLLARFFLGMMMALPLCAAQEITEDRIQAKLKEVEALRDLPEETRAKITDLYKQALTQLAQMASHKTECAVFQASKETATEEAKATLAEQKAMANQPADDPVDPQAKASELDDLVTKAKTDLADAKNGMDALNDLLKIQQDRKEKFGQEQTAVQKALDVLENSLEDEPPKDTHPLMIDASRTLLMARFMAQTEELAMLKQEHLSHPMRLDLLTAKKALAEATIAHQEKRLEFLEAELKKAKQKEADANKDKTEQDRKKAAGKAEDIQALADENVALSDDNKTILGKDETAQIDRKTLEDQETLWDEAYKRTQQQLERVGLSGIPGEEMRDKRSQLPELFRLMQRIASKWDKEIPKAESNRFKYGLERQRLGDVAKDAVKLNAHNLDREIEKINTQRKLDSAPPLSPAERTEIRELLTTKLETLNMLNQNYDTYLKNLRELESLLHTIRDTARQFTLLLDEKMLWIPSTSLPGRQTAVDLGQAAAWFFSPTHWGNACRALSPNLGTTPYQAAALFLLALLIGLRRRILEDIKRSGEIVGKVLKDKFTFTTRALFLTALLAVPIPLLLCSLAWPLARAAGQTPLPFTTAAGEALLSVSGLLFALLFFARLIMPGGVGEAHFKWHPSATALLRRHLPWLSWVLATSSFLVIIFRLQPEEAYHNSLGRLAFLIAMGSLTCFVRCILKPQKGITADILARFPSGWLARLRHIWYPLAIGIPLVLSLAALVGYYYTALELQDCAIHTVWLIIGIIIIRQMTLRWFVLEERRLALKKAREKRAAKREAEAKAGDPDQAPAPVIEVPEEVLEIDISKIKAQSLQLVQTLVGVTVILGLWTIWASVLPALSILDNVTLWSIKAADDAGALITQTITLQDLALSLIALILTVAAAKNLPGVLEIIVLKRLPIVPGMRYAITTLCQYVLSIVGIIIAFNVIGIGWAKVQWLVAALSVGIGFGLQEIIANFFCGIILLFERPIRIGDIVTVGDVMGVVSRIRIRATTITNWDRMEYVVPNKELITGRLLNWTLTNSINRIVINVGAAYGSDIRKVRDILLKVAADHSLLMDDPAPMVTMEGFGDSSLNFVLRCYLANFDNRLKVIHELHAAIDEAFSKAGIEIPFPQRDMHVYNQE